MSTGNSRVQFLAAEILCTIQFSTISKCGWKDSIVGKWINIRGGDKILGTPRSQITAI
jgi:hypothetical protein